MLLLPAVEPVGLLLPAHLLAGEPAAHLPAQEPVAHLLSSHLLPAHLLPPSPQELQESQARR